MKYNIILSKSYKFALEVILFCFALQEKKLTAGFG